MLPAITIYKTNRCRLTQPFPPLDLLLMSNHHAHLGTVVDTFLVSFDTSAGQYVFVPAAMEYFPQTDHLSGIAVIHECCFVCLRPWRWCRLIWLSPAHKITAASMAFLSLLHFYLFQFFTQLLQSLAACASFPFPLQPGHSCGQNIHEYVFTHTVLIPLTFQTPLLLPLFYPRYHFTSNLTQLYGAVSVFALWPLCNSVTEVTADRFLRKSDCRVW